MDRPSDHPAERVLLLAPTSKDAAAGEVLLRREGLGCIICRDLDVLCEEARHGAAVVVVPEEAILLDRAGRVAGLMADQPPWSDLPLLVLTAAGPGSRRSMIVLQTVGHATLIRRPLQRSAFVSAVASALRDRRRQYRMRDLLLERENQAARLEEADRRKDEFLAMLAHELRNPLAAIVGAVGLALAPRAAQFIPDSLDVIRRQSNTLSRLVSDLLDVARVSRGKLELRREIVDASAVARQAARSVKAIADRKRQTLTVDAPVEPLYVDADPTRLEQIVGNLLNNAAKYTEQEGRISLTVVREGYEAVIRVEDDGVGITPEMLPRIFDLFAQVDQSLARTEGGLGIGLTLVKRLVEMHGGTIEATSEVGHGSVFTVRLRLHAGPDAASAEATAQRTTTARRVLIIDDNVDSARLMGLFLETLGHQVRVSNDGTSAADAARDFTPEVILLDIGLPDLDGYEVARLLRREPLCARSLIVAVTGYADESSMTRGWDAGFDHYFAKPVDLEVLASLIEQLP
ncbi:hybrid sensor histidine kinase/response regulator [Paludisphaera rhizosphaerae]|uniref:hybrid sensor histidine kinase/response regulator n=1 Tax=Paludisphaera rhizosphaerae TaxID=2711216 RepID=UPI0013EDB3D9|nr:ATP-binding protein [Paludisphaera rhizosphaerae]